MPGGDDLDDDFVPDDLVALSDGGDVDTGSQDSWTGVDGDDNSPEGDTQPSASNQKELKKRKRKEKEKERKAKRRKLEQSTSTDVDNQASIASQPSEALSDYLAELQAKTLPKLSTIELEDLRIQSSCIVDTTLWSGSRSLDVLPDFISKLLPTLKTRLGQKPKSQGAPTLLYVAGAALRVADVTRILKQMKGTNPKAGEIAKLFAKHFKLEDHVHYLKRTRIAAAVGTPGRLGKLLVDTDPLSLSALTHIILDTSHKDLKKRSMFDIPETRDEVFRLVLGAKPIRDSLASGKVSLVLF